MENKPEIVQVNIQMKNRSYFDEKSIKKLTKLILDYLKDNKYSTYITKNGPDNL